MPSQSWQQTLVTSNGVDGPAITNSTTQATLLQPAMQFTLPANFQPIQLTCR